MEQKLHCFLELTIKEKNMATERTLLTLQEQSSWMTEEVQKVEDCKGTTVTVQYRFQTPDAYGVNWSDNVIFSPGPNASRDVVLSLVGNLVREAREKFNVR